MNSKNVKKIVGNAIENTQHLDGALLPLLHQVQSDLGYVPEDQVPEIAKALNLSRAEVHGVISFYHSFRNKPKGKHVIEICRAESCQALGSRQLEATAKETLGIDFEQTTSDGEFTLQAVYCLGNCACSPAIKIDSQLHGRVTNENIVSLIENTRSGESK